LLVIIVVTFSVGAIRWQKMKTAYRFLLILTFVELCGEVGSKWCAYNLKNSMPAYHLLVNLQLVLYPFIYMYTFSKRSVARAVLIAVSVVAPILSIFLSLSSGLFVFPSYNVLLVAFVVITCSLFSFADMLNTPEIKLHKRSLFWMNFGNLFFYCLNFFVFGFFAPLVKKHGEIPYWAFYMLFYSNFPFYFCYLMAFLQQKKTHELVRS
jgi:hypothetical protein